MRKEISSKIFHTLMASCLVALSLVLLVPNAQAQGTPMWHGGEYYQSEWEIG